METINKGSLVDTEVRRKGTNTPAAFLDIGIGSKVPLIYENCLLQCLKPHHHFSRK